MRLEQPGMPNQIVRQFESAEFGTVRALTIDSEPWFVAKDVCDALGIRTNTVRTILDEDEVAEANANSIDIGPEFGGRAPLIITEAGLYSLILRSRKPEAKAFKRWVTHEVLPAIRRDGGYMAVRDNESPEETMARAVLIAQQTIDRQRLRLHEQAAQIDEMRPKALFADAVAASDGTCLVGELAKMLTQAGYKVGQNRLFRRLRDEGFLGKSGSNYNVPLQRYIEMGLFRIKETAVTHPDGHVTINRTPKVTGKGQRYFIDRFCGNTNG